jgi:hypothetical protein
VDALEAQLPPQRVQLLLVAGEGVQAGLGKAVHESGGEADPEHFHDFLLF